MKIYLPSAGALRPLGSAAARLRPRQWLWRPKFRSEAQRETAMGSWSCR